MNLTSPVQSDGSANQPVYNFMRDLAFVLGAVQQHSMEVAYTQED